MELSETPDAASTIEARLRDRYKDVADRITLKLGSTFDDYELSRPEEAIETRQMTRRLARTLLGHASDEAEEAAYRALRFSVTLMDEVSPYDTYQLSINEYLSFLASFPDPLETLLEDSRAFAMSRRLLDQITSDFMQDIDPSGQWTMSVVKPIAMMALRVAETNISDRMILDAMDNSS